MNYIIIYSNHSGCGWQENRAIVIITHPSPPHLPSKGCGGGWCVCMSLSPHKRFIMRMKWHIIYTVKKYGVEGVTRRRPRFIISVYNGYMKSAKVDCVSQVLLSSSLLLLLLVYGSTFGIEAVVTPTIMPSHKRGERVHGLRDRLKQTIGRGSGWVA